MKLLVGIVGLVSAIVVLGAVMPFFEYDEEDNNDLYLFVITGQSNAAYFVADTTVANELSAPPQGKAFYYGTSNKPMYYGVNPSNPSYDPTFESYSIQDITNAQGKFKIGGLESALSSKFYNETGKTALFVNTSIGGQSITQMQPGELGYEYAADVIDHALASVEPNYHIIPCGIFFIQGESDASMSIDQYSVNFRSMAAAYTSMAHCDKIILGEVRPANAPQIAAAQLQLCDDLSGVYLGSMASGTFTTTNGLMRSDNLHYTQAGKNIIGTQLMEKYLSVSAGQFNDPMEAYASLVSIIPAVIIVALVSMAVGALYLKRND